MARPAVSMRRGVSRAYTAVLLAVAGLCLLLAVVEAVLLARGGGSTGVLVVAVVVGLGLAPGAVMRRRRLRRG